MLKQNIILLEEDVVVRIPRVREVEEILEIPTPIITRVPQKIEVPIYEVETKKHQLVQHQYIVTEKPYPVTVEKPVVQEVEKVVLIQKLTYEEKEVPIPRYRVVPGEQPVVRMPREAIIDIRCKCGNVYASNHTKCLQCGRTTVDNLKVDE